MLLFDHLLAAVLVVAIPLYGRWEFPRLLRAVERGDPDVRRREYRWITAMHIGLGTATVVLWLAAGRDPAALGIAQPHGVGFWASLAGAGLVIAYLVWQLTAVGRSDDLKNRLRAQLGQLEKFLPQSEREMRAFSVVSITAMLEELLYRGFLIWYAAAFMPVWAALVATSLAFGAAHLYQGWGGAVKTGTVGFILGGLYLLSGSLWVPMMLHGAGDLIQGRTVYQVLRPEAAA